MAMRSIEFTFSSKSFVHPENGALPIETLEKPMFICPAHSCWTCTQTKEQDQEKRTADVPGKDPIKKGKRPKKSKSAGVFICKTERHMVVRTASSHSSPFEFESSDSSFSHPTSVASFVRYRIT
jgi:hypothetical protein